MDACDFQKVIHLTILQEIVQDLEEMQASDDAKAFVYFTKESHIYTLLNCILEGGIETKIKRSAIPELDYLSQICFELYESENKTPLDAQDVAKYAYSIRISISPGAHTFDPLDVQLDSKHCIGCAPRRSLTAHADWKYVIDTLRAKFHQYDLSYSTLPHYGLKNLQDEQYTNQCIMNRVKLPKSFLAVNLSESHTFHKKEELEHAQGDSTIAEGLSVEPETEIANEHENREETTDKMDVEDGAGAISQEDADPALVLGQPSDGLNVTTATGDVASSVPKSHSEPV